MHRTHRWLERGLAARTRADQAFFGIVQGGVEPDLRKASAEFITRLDLPGYAIGGLSVGEPKEQMLAILDGLMPLLPADRPRYLMGVGSPEDLVEGVARGVDLFDCVLATRIARNGALLVRTGRVNIRNAQYREDPNPIEPGCTCATCRHFSRAYIHHLFRAEELLGYRLTSLHNIHFLARLMEEIRRSVAAGTFPAFRRDFLAGFDVRDEGVRRENRDARRHSQPD